MSPTTTVYSEPTDSVTSASSVTCWHHQLKSWWSDSHLWVIAVCVEQWMLNFCFPLDFLWIIKTQSVIFVFTCHCSIQNSSILERNLFLFSATGVISVCACGVRVNRSKSFMSSSTWVNFNTIFEPLTNSKLSWQATLLGIHCFTKEAVYDSYETEVCGTSMSLEWRAIVTDWRQHVPSWLVC